MFFALNIAVLLNGLTPLRAQTWLASVHVKPDGYTRGTNAVAVRPGDTVVVQASLNEDDLTTMHVWTGSQHTLDLRPGHSSDRTAYVAQSTSEFVDGRMGIYDADDDGFIQIGIMPRGNLTALRPVVEGDGSLSYGYQVAGSWNPWGHVVEVGLYYAHGSQLIGHPIATHSMLTAANAHGWFNVPAANIPPPPPGADGILSRVDLLDVVPESNEADNIAATPLPDLRVVAPSYDRYGNITYGYQILNTGVRTTQYVTLGLFYATGPNQADIISDLPPVHETTLDLSAGPVHAFTLNVGTYPLASSEARYLVGVIARNCAIVEGDPGKTDNVASTPCQIAPGFRQVGGASGVGVYQRDIPGATFYATVVDLGKATLGQMAESSGYEKLRPWWTHGMRFNTSTRTLTALVNGTEFGPDWFSNLSGAKIEYADSLKVDGQVFDYGAKAAIPANQRVLFTYNGDTAAILGYSRSAMDDSRYPNLIGVISGTHTTNATGASRQWVGLRDVNGSGARGEPRCRTVVFLTMPDSVTWTTADGMMEAFGVADASRAQLDGGGSTTLLVGEQVLCQPKSVLGFQRELPHVITIYSGK